MRSIEKNLKNKDDDTSPDNDKDEAGDIYTSFLQKKKKHYTLQKAFVKKKKH